ncbi:hypothetical protein LTR84_004143 [Exophiala bonariae]|uniref:Uncharacterized protein n=1 Tax=Exophiala bonariae TaxID=1690606 RepID=A0AAV9N5L2_9EURO|nr:hypothetical protein LTR84_004143 [Exophiala bonariae]
MSKSISSRGFNGSSKDDHDHFRHDNPRPTFADPPFSCRASLFCCPVAESNPSHLPRTFVNPGRHLMNLQLRSFLECADHPDHTIPKCDVSHIVEVTTRLLQNGLTHLNDGQGNQEQWNVRAAVGCKEHVAFKTPPLEEDESNGMVLDQDMQEDIPYSTYQSMSTRQFVTQNGSNTWQVPPHSRQYRDNHPDHSQGRSRVEKYMEIPPFKTIPYTSDGSSGNGASGLMSARPWIPSCSLLMWCTRHNMFYEIHVLS